MPDLCFHKVGAIRDKYIKLEIPYPLTASEVSDSGLAFS